MVVPKSQLKGSTGLPITESLFLECGYNPDAVYSLKEEDCDYNGKIYPSIKLLYLSEVTSPVDGEYDFANKYFLNWSHWERICRNKRLRAYIDEWRDELEVKLRSKGLSQVISHAEEGNYQAAKWLAEGMFSKRGAGRPTKEEKERKLAQDSRIADEWQADLDRVNAIQ